MAISFSGTLEGVGVASFIAFLAGVHKSGRLHVFQRAWSGDVRFDEGLIVAASFGEERGLAALEAIVLALPSGQFTFTEDAPGAAAAPEERTISVTAETLHTYLARLAALQQKVGLPEPALTAVPRVIELAAEPDAAQDVVIDCRTLRTLSAVDGRRTIEEIVRRRGTVEAIMDLAELAELGLVGFQPYAGTGPSIGATGAPAAALVGAGGTSAVPTSLSARLAPAPPVPPHGSVPPPAVPHGGGRHYWARTAALAAVATILLALNVWQEARIPSTPRLVVSPPAAAGAELPPARAVYLPGR